MMFDRCDPQAAASDHGDGGSSNSTTTGAVVTATRRRCLRQAHYRQRGVEDRERVRKPMADSRREARTRHGLRGLSPSPAYGAVEDRPAIVFYERQGDGPETPASASARFSVLWRLEGDGRWRLARAFSIDHEALFPTGRRARSANKKAPERLRRGLGRSDRGSAAVQRAAWKVSTEAVTRSLIGLKLSLTVVVTISFVLDSSAT